MAQFTGPTLAAVGDDARRSTTALQSVGVVAHDAVGNEYTYVKAGATIAANDSVRLNANFDDVRPTSAVNQAAIGVATAAFASGEYGFILSKGRATAKVAAATAANALLVTSGVAGTLATAAATDVVSRGAVAVTAESGGLATVLFL
jgi:hypothetical protein